MDLESFIRGFALCALGLIFALAFDGRTPKTLRWALALYCLSAINNLFAGPALIGAGHIGWMWLLAKVMFEDRPLKPLLFVPAAALFAAQLIETGLAGLDPPAGALRGVGVVVRVAEIGLFLHMLVIVVRTWRVDFVETRRRLRLWLLASVAGYGALYGMGSLTGFRPPWMDAANTVIQAAMIFAGFALLLQLRDDLILPRSEKAAGAEAPSAASRQALARLEALMTKDELWRQEALTIGALAAAAGASERQLRRLVNERLGHRNFVAYLNGFRIEAAKTQLLADPACTVAKAAFSVGYTSLGPFNRAFKEATGETPTAWRRARQAG